MSLNQSYTFSTINGIFLNDSLIEELASLYSEHYGVWDQESTKHGNVRLSSARLKAEFISPSSCVVTAREKEKGRLIGYAIALKDTFKSRKITWVIQFVVHKDYRNQNIGKMLLYSLWGEFGLDACGIITANPYAIRALEKATHRRCDLYHIQKNKQWLFEYACENISYIDDKTEFEVNKKNSRINTIFYVDHSSVPKMIEEVSCSIPWILGTLERGWEWFAVTFRNQKVFPLSHDEIQLMLDTSDEVTQQAYSKMQIDSHPWAKYSPQEVDYILSKVQLNPNAKILDLGCGNGRHSILFANMGYNVTAVDYNCYDENLHHIQNLHFIKRDIRDIKKDSIDKDFDLVLCLYDVIGTYADDTQNKKIAKELFDHLSPNGIAFISVMNYDFLSTTELPKYLEIGEDLNVLFDLDGQNTMEKTGDIFNCKMFVDPKTHVCYRRELFSGSEEDLFREFFVRDRRYTIEEIQSLLSDVGFQIIETSFVRAGKWTSPFDRTNGKEILLMCKKESQQETEQMNFEI